MNQLPSPPLKGPRHLLEWLVSGHPEPGLYLVGLDSERRAVHLSHTSAEFSLPKSLDQTDESSDETDETEHWVPVCVAASHSEALDLLALARTWRDSAAGPLLDVLVTDSEDWWSALCVDEACCPAAGRPIDPARLAEDRAANWRQALSGNPPEDLGSLVEELAEIELRDALLVAIADSETRSRWRELYPALEDSARAESCSASSRAALLTAQATAHFLDGELELAKDFALQSQELIEDYSYARLLIAALDNHAPRALLFDALSAAGANLPVLSVAAS